MVHEIFPSHREGSESEERTSLSEDLLPALWKNAEAQPHSIESVKIG